MLRERHRGDCGISDPRPPHHVPIMWVVRAECRSAEATVRASSRKQGTLLLVTSYFPRWEVCPRRRIGPKRSGFAYASANKVCWSGSETEYLYK